MIQLLSSLRNILAASVISLLMVIAPLAGSPVVAFAEEAPVCTAPASDTPGVHWPTGADAVAFQYQCDGEYAGKWISAHYVFDPISTDRTSRDPAIYTYNESTSKWDTTVWFWDAGKATYTPYVQSVSQPPAGAIKIGGPKPPAPVAKALPGESEESDAAALGGEGPGSENGANFTGTNNSTYNNRTNGTMRNGILSYAGTGEALVNGNTDAGSATSGDAQVIANMINMLQSSSNILNDQGVSTFTFDINGDVNGDLLFDPSQLGDVQPANSSATLDNNLTINNSVDASIDNDITLDAESGDAAVTRNTKAGDAKSGDASVMANVINVLNSAITAQRSFVGVININGNLNGDILLPPGFIDELLASNVPRYTLDTSEINSNTTVTNNNKESINNAIDASANSGNASVANNTAAGSATTGSADTELTVFNLTGSEVVAENNILVFVSVHGTWYGFIMNAPPGSTAASLGGGVSKNTKITDNAALNNDNDLSINNNITARSKSGDATVSENTEAGNAKSGNAKTSVNIANFIDSKLKLSGWFGILFIRVNGSWNGSFGVNTAAGNPPIVTPTQGTGVAPLQVFQFIPSGTSSQDEDDSSSSPVVAGEASGVSGDGVVLASAKLAGDGSRTSSASDSASSSNASNKFIIPAIGLGLAALLLFFGERKRASINH